MYAPGSLRAHVNVDYKAQYQPSTSSSSTEAPVGADNISGILKEYMAPGKDPTPIPEKQHG